MEQEVLGLSQETADRLLKALEDMNQESEMISDSVAKMIRNAVAITIIQKTEKYLYYTERHLKAWPFTRWWWKRKVVRAAADVEKAEKFANEMKGEGMFEPLCS